MRKNKLLLLSTLLYLSITALGQQSYLHQVIVLNEGPFGGPATVGAYDPVGKNYQTFDQIDAAFASDVLVKDGFIYVAADSLLIKYDANTLQRLVTQQVTGIRELAVWNDHILVSRADISPLPSYFQAYHIQDLSLAYEITAVSERSSQIEVVGDKAYMIVNGWGTVGKIAIIDLMGEQLEQEVDLGPEGLNPEALYRQQGNLYTVNAMDWTASSVSKYNISGSTVQNQSFYHQSACAGSAMYLNNLYFQPYTDTTGAAMNKSLGVINGGSLNLWDTLDVGRSIYGMGIDSMNATIYLGTTDYATYGTVYQYDFYGQVLDSFDVEVSPGTFAFDVREVTGIQEHRTAVLTVGPNPFNDHVTVHCGSGVDAILIYDVQGRLLVERGYVEPGLFAWDLSGLERGTYTLTTLSNGILESQLIIKQ